MPSLSLVPPNVPPVISTTPLTQIAPPYGNNARVNAGGVHVNGTFTMNGGIIKNNSVQSDCAGVYLCENSTFVMNDGEISGNTSTQIAPPYP